MSGLESDPLYGLHVNLHVQPHGGGSDYANYHISYYGTDQYGNPDWEVYDSISGDAALYEGYAGEAIDESAYAAACDFAGVVGEAFDQALELALIAATELCEFGIVAWAFIALF